MESRVFVSHDIAVMACGIAAKIDSGTTTINK